MNGNEQWGGYHVVLASASPRRKELLNQIGIFPEIRPSQMEEETVEKKPEQVVMELSRQKAEDIAAGCGTGTMVIGADTVVAVGNEILGKPGTPMRAYEMIGKLQGEKTDVHVYPMTPGEMSEYAECGEPLDKAGAYGIQGRFAAYIKGIDGDYANVVGLPLGRLNQEIKGLLEDWEDD